MVTYDAYDAYDAYDVFVYYSTHIPHIPHMFLCIIHIIRKFLMHVSAIKENSIYTSHLILASGW